MLEKNKIAAIVLAAGTSYRFGTNKLLHPLTLDGVTMPLAAHSLLPWLEVFARITVVVGLDAEKFCKEIDNALGKSNAADIHWTVCEKSATGMSASLVCGVRANLMTSGWVVGLADMPTVPSSAIASVSQALLEGANLVAPFYEGKRGHPVGFASHYKEDLLLLQGDAGARHLLERDKTQLVKIKIEDSGIFADVDTLTDLQNF